MKILCVGSHQKPSNALRRAEAFVNLGHTVECLDTSKFGYSKYEFLRKVVLGYGMPIIRLLLLRALLKRIRTHKPDIVFFEKSTWFKAGFADKIKRLSSSPLLLVHYNPDDPFGHFGSRYWDVFINAIPEYDVHFVPKNDNLLDYKEQGAKRVFVFDRAFDKELHRPIQLFGPDADKYSCEIGFIGTWAKHRELMIAKLIEEGIPVAIWGSGWQRGNKWSTVQPFWRGPTQIEEDYVKAICGMKIALHFLRRENRDEQDSRSFEIPACGTFMLAERSEAHERLFEDGKEAVFFDDFEDLQTKISYYLEHEVERKAIAQAGRERCLRSGYDHDSRLQVFLSHIMGAESGT